MKLQPDGAIVWPEVALARTKHFFSPFLFSWLCKQALGLILEGCVFVSMS